MNIRQQDHCVIKCIVHGNKARVKKRRFASPVLHSCNVKTQICVTRPQCVNTAQVHRLTMIFEMNKLPPSLGWCNYIQIYTLKCYQCNGQYEGGGHTLLQNVSVNLWYSVMTKPRRRPHNMKNVHNVNPSEMTQYISTLSYRAPAPYCA